MPAIDIAGCGIEEFATTRFRHLLCRKTFASRRQAISHVREGCIRNPATRACPTCANELERPTGERLCGVDVPERADVIYVRHCPSWDAR